MLPAHALDGAERAARACRVMVVVGTSGAVWPAAGLAAVARARGATVAIVNPNPSDIDGDAEVVLRGTAARVLPALFDAL
jgi:NAD-dependent deacetylase